MDDLIRRQDAQNITGELLSGWLTDGERNILESVDADLGELPSADAVEVVRCKDCKHLFEDNGCPLRYFKTHREDDFCSYGERRTDG